MLLENFMSKNYPTHELKLETMGFAFKILRHYFYGIHVDIFYRSKVFGTCS